MAPSGGARAGRGACPSERPENRVGCGRSSLGDGMNAALGWDGTRRCMGARASRFVVNGVGTVGNMPPPPLTCDRDCCADGAAIRAAGGVSIVKRIVCCRYNAAQPRVAVSALAGPIVTSSTREVYTVRGGRCVRRSPDRALRHQTEPTPGLRQTHGAASPQYRRRPHPPAGTIHGPGQRR